jgi:hypothetical protein
MAWQRSPQVVYEVVDGQAVLLDAAGVELITLNAVGTLVWQQLDGAREEAELAAELSGHFPSVGEADLENDIGAFLAELAAGALVLPSDG